MNAREELIRKLQDEIDRCKVAKLDSRTEHDMEKLTLSALNTRLTDYDKRIAAAEAELHKLQAQPGADVLNSGRSGPSKEDAIIIPPSGGSGGPKPDLPLTETGGDQWDVFVSYQPDSEAEARELYQELSAVGLRVWQDVNNITQSGLRSLAIDGALRRAERLVLLLSPRAMASREVFNEWFYFYGNQKPIHCLMAYICEPDYRLLPYPFLDWREPNRRDWARLLRELQTDFQAPAAITPSPIVIAPAAATAEPNPALADLLQAARDPDGRIALTEAQITMLAAHKPADLAEYRLGRVAEWSRPRYALDKRFVNLTLLLDKGEDAPQRWQAEDFRFNDLREVLAKVPEPALVLLGAPGSGKSTLLRRFQMDHNIDQLRDDGPQVTFFVQLNSYREEAEPRSWLESAWTKRYPALAPLDDLLRQGRLILLLDALNEMPHNSEDAYRRRVGLWRDLTQEIVQQGNRAIFSCRSLDYSASLSSKTLRVPQIEVQPMSPAQVRRFIDLYSPTQAERIWSELDDTPQFDLYRTPIFLKLLLEQVERDQRLPKGKAELFTQFVRRQIMRNLETPPLNAEGLFDRRDHAKLARDQWKSPFELPERGSLLPELSGLAFAMQQSGLETEGALVRIDYDEACALLHSDRAEDILPAGLALTVLDEDIARDEIFFFHQLLQEFFAARQLAQAPDPMLVHRSWTVDTVSPALDETLEKLADGDPLPPLPQTGWEETTLTAAPMAKDPTAFIRDLMPANLPLAARCAASPEVPLDPELKHDLRTGLIARTQDMNADLRARIAAGLALGLLGDPRFAYQTGPHGDFLLPPLVTIEGGVYSLGDNDSQYDFEKPAHSVELAAFQIGQFPVTNAEYALFMAARGYEDEQWWDSAEAQAWRRGEGSTEGSKQQWRDNRKTFQSWAETDIQELVTQNRITSKQADDWIIIRNWTDERFEEWLEESFPAGKIYREPGFWQDTRFSNPAQPVVGVTWFEARAYCRWLSAQTGQAFELPSEAQFEAAARGQRGRPYPYGDTFEVSRSNTFESHIRRTTPVGIFDNATPEGAFDLSGNAYTWTTSIYDQEQFPYPYQADDGRENISSTARRVLRGGSWSHDGIYARAVSRNVVHPGDRVSDVGFRVCRPPSF